MRGIQRINILIICLPALLCACGPQNNFEIKIGSSPNDLKICMNSEPECDGSGVSFSSIYIAESSASGEDLDLNTKKLRSPVWVIESATNDEIKELTYAITPEGWTEVVPAKTLEIGKVYSFNGEVTFVIRQAGSNLEVKVLRRLGE